MTALDDVPWGELYGPHGTSEDVPRLLRAADPAVLDHLLHQGTRWQVTAAAVPFLVALVDDPATPRRAEFAAGLAAVVRGSLRADALPFDAAALHPRAGGLTPERERRVIAAVYHGEEPDEDAEAAVDRWALDAYEAVAERVPVIAGWVAGPDPVVAGEAAALLAWFPPTPATLDALLAGGPAAASANLALAHLGGDDARIEGFLRYQMGNDDAQIALTAAIALACRLGEDAPDPALTLLVEAAERDRLPPDVPGWADRALRGYVAKALRAMDLG